MTALYVTGAGLVTPGMPDWRAAVAVLTGAEPWDRTRAELPAPAILPKNERRRSTPAIRLALEAAHQAASAAGLPLDALPTVFGSACGDGEVVDRLLATVTGPEPRVSPTLFHNSVHNAPAGYWCIAAGAREPSLSIGAFEATPAATLLTAAVQARRGPVLAGVYDAPLPEPLNAVRPIVMPFGAALVLAPSPSPGALGRLSVRLGGRAEVATRPEAAALAELFDGNPAAGLLPVLEALACRRGRAIVLPWDGAPTLVVEVAPC